MRGYKITAEYIGEVCRTGVSVIRYTVIFAGTKIAPPATTEPVPVMTEPEPDTKEDEPDVGAEAGLENETEDDYETLSEPGSKKDSRFNWLFVVIPLALLAVASTAILIYMYLKKRKEQETHEETEENTDYDYIGSDYNDSGSDSGDGGDDEV